MPNDFPDRRAELLSIIATERDAGRLKGQIPPHYVSRKIADALAELATIDPESYSAGAEAVKHAIECHGGNSRTPGDESGIQHKFAVVHNHAFCSLTSEIIAVHHDTVDHDAALGWREPDDKGPSEYDASMVQASEFLGEVVRWFAESESLNSMGLRAAALCVLLQPNSVSPDGSQSGAAKRFGVHRAAIQKHCRAVRAMAHGHFQARNQRPQDECEEARQRAHEQHARAGHRTKPRAR